MAKAQRDKIEYDFEDLRRNEDPVDSAVLDQLGLDDADLTDDERHDDKKARDDGELDDKDDLDDTDADLEDDGEYSPAKMTKAMRKRIVGIKRDANRAIAAAKAEAGEEISKLNKRVADLERSGKTDAIDDEFGTKVADLEERIEAAMEDGDSKIVFKLTRELGDLTADVKERKRRLEAEDVEPDDLDEGTDKIIPRAMEWVKEQDWWDDEDLGHVRAYVRKADMALQKKGYNPTDDDFYEQLEALVEKKYPGVVEHTMDLDEEDNDLDLDEEDEFDEIPSKRRRKLKKKSRRRSPVSEGDRGGVARASKKRRAKKERTLTRARIANMRTFGMDPENPEHVEAYLDNNP